MPSMQASPRFRRAAKKKIPNSESSRGFPWLDFLPWVQAVELSQAASSFQSDTFLLGVGTCASRTSFTEQTGNILYTLVVPFASFHSSGLMLSAGVGPQRRGASEARHPGAEDQPWRTTAAQLHAHGFRSSTVSSLISRFLSSSVANFIGPKRISQMPSAKGSKATSSPPRASLKNIRSPCHKMSPCG